MDAVNDRAIEGLGTTEAQWLGWSGLANIPLTTLDELAPPGRRVVVVAPHPDDEVLAAGGLIALLVDAGRMPLLIAATDGTASHMGSTEWTADRLEQERPRETKAALYVLRLRDSTPIRLRLPDGGLQAQRQRLADTLSSTSSWPHVAIVCWPATLATPRRRVPAPAASPTFRSKRTCCRMNGLATLARLT